MRSESKIYVLRKSVHLLSRKDRQKLVVVMLVQAFLGLVDLVAVAAIGILGAITVGGLQAGTTSGRTLKVLEFLNIANLPLQNQAFVLGSLAAILLVSRTLLSMFFVRKILFFLSRRGSEISSSLVAKLLGQDLLTVQSNSIQGTIWNLTHGVNVIALGVLGTFVTMVSESSLLFVLVLGLFLLDPLIGLTTVGIFVLVGFASYQILHVRAQRLGANFTKEHIASNELLFEALVTFREVLVKNRITHYVNQISNSRLKIANTQAEMQFLPNVSKYVIEITVVVSSLLVCGIQFWLQDARQAISTLAVFLAAATRIAPAAMRLQQGAIDIKVNTGSALPTLELIDYLRSKQSRNQRAVLESSEKFVPEIDLTHIQFSYPNSGEFTLHDVTLRVESGEFLAIVGPSGSGKSTLLDLIMGSLDPQSGKVQISGETPIVAFSKWPGSVGYVPQSIEIVKGSIKSNVALGFDPTEIADESVWDSLDLAQLGDFVRSLPDELNTEVGERGTQLSGGQRQRLGIARALLTKPTLLILDEATSALDTETESLLSKALLGLRGQTTVVMIAHRLSSVKSADKVVYMDSGRIKALGTMDEVRKQVPGFEIQAKLIGL